MPRSESATLQLRRSVPPAVQVAAGIWVLCGVVNIFNALTFMGLTYSVPLGALLVSVGVMFVGMGAQALMGELEDPLLYGAFSLLASLSTVLGAEAIARMNLGNALLTGLLFAAGVLALAGRRAYLARGA